MVLDAEDAFWQIPLHPAERRFYCTLLRMPNGGTRYLAFNRTAQGSRGAPLSWAVMFGLICRCALNTLLVPDVGGRVAGTGAAPQRMQVYVDDPILIVRGTRQFRDKQFAMIMLAWAVLGINSAIRKGQVGAEIDWIGCSLAIRSDAVVATILAARLDDVRQLVEQAKGKYTIPIRELRTLVGKVQSLALLLYVWRPFVPMFYAALYSSGGGAPPQCAWTKQVAIPLAWVKAFLDGQSGNLHRTFSLDSH